MACIAYTHAGITLSNPSQRHVHRELLGLVFRSRGATRAGHLILDFQPMRLPFATVGLQRQGCDRSQIGLPVGVIRRIVKPITMGAAEA
jgi:hypothetical protein